MSATTARERVVGDKATYLDIVRAAYLRRIEDGQRSILFAARRYRAPCQPGNMRGYLQSAAITLRVQTRFARRVARDSRVPRETRRCVVSGHLMMRNVRTRRIHGTRFVSAIAAVPFANDDESARAPFRWKHPGIPDLTWTRILKFVAAISHSLVQVEL